MLLLLLHENKMTRETALRIKAQQEHASTLLVPNSLYIALYIRTDPPTANDFHWAFYHRSQQQQPSPNAKVAGGTKHEAVNNPQWWCVQHTSTGCLFKTAFLCVVIQIAEIAEARVPEMEAIMRERDDDVNEIEGVTCRVWLKGTLDRLVRDGVVECRGDLGGRDLGDVVQEEVFAIGNEFMDDAARNVQPRPMVKSKIFYDA